MKQIFQLLAPYFALGIFWCIFSNAWLALLAYHAQILFWSWGSFPNISTPKRKRFVFLALPTVLGGPLVYVLLPYITQTDLTAWLEQYQLSRVSLAIMIPYFGLIHPFLEQIHWRKLRETYKASHFLFAGYHVLVLYSLLKRPWLLVCFAVLTTASFLWQQMEERSQTLAIPVGSHILADMGIIVAVWIQQ